MKSIKLLIYFSLFILMPLQLSQAAEEVDAIAKAKETTNLAKIAKAKARLRLEQAKDSDSESSPLSSFDTAGCDINIGNVALDGLSDSPEEITIIIDGDIIQSNNCR